MDPVRAPRARGLTGAASSAVAGTRVVVLGGSGFIGSAVVARFVAAGAVVRAVSRSGRPPVAGVEGVAADPMEPGRVAAVVAEAGGVRPRGLYSGGGTYRLDGGEAEAAARLNVAVVRSVVEAAAGRMVVFA